MCCGLRVWPIFVPGFCASIQNFLLFGFSKSYSQCGLLRSKHQLSNAENNAQRFSEKENAKNTQRSRTKIEDFCAAFGFGSFYFQVFRFSQILVQVCSRFWYSAKPPSVTSSNLEVKMNCTNGME